MSSTYHAWTLIAWSSGITIAGSCTIYLDIVWNKLFGRCKRISILNNRHFMVTTLSLSAGVLLFTALHSLLTSAQKYFRKSDATKQEANRLLLASVVVGFAICFTINFVIHSVTSKSIVHCAHEGAHDEEQAIQHDHSHDHAHEPEVDERTPLNEDPRRLHFKQYISTESLHQGGPLAHGSLIDRLQKAPCEGECRGFDSLYQCAHEIHNTHRSHKSTRSRNSSISFPGVFIERGAPATRYPAPDDSRDEPAVHHHHVVPQFSQLLSIGVQTAFAITVHKLPEGFLLFATDKADKRVGLNVFVALAIHNFFEGFTIACPLYLALESRALAVLFAAILGAGAQPLGALLAQNLFKAGLSKTNYTQFGALVGGSAGFMTIIALQMLCTAVSYGGSPHTVTLCCVFGIVVVLASNCL